MILFCIRCNCKCPCGLISCQASSQEIMLSFSTVCVLLFALLSSSANLDDCELDSISVQQDIRLSRPGYSRLNCSARYASPQTYDVTQFAGVWNYVELFTAKPLLSNPGCMRLVANLEPDDKLVMNVEIRRPHDKTIRASVFGYVDDDEAKRESVWNLYSDVSLVPSKWIVLSGDDRLTLYMICGDYPDGSSVVGEIGILSRDTQLSKDDAARFKKYLDWHGLLELQLKHVSQTNCPN